MSFKKTVFTKHTQMQIYIYIFYIFTLIYSDQLPIPPTKLALNADCSCIVLDLLSSHIYKHKYNSKWSFAKVIENKRKIIFKAVEDRCFSRVQDLKNKFTLFCFLNSFTEWTSLRLLGNDVVDIIYPLFFVCEEHKRNFPFSLVLSQLLFQIWREIFCQYHISQSLMSVHDYFQKLWGWN